MKALIYSFGPFRFDAVRGELTREGVPLIVGGRALQLLDALLKRNGGLASKDELFEILWPNLVVEEGNLSTQVWGLRKALGDLERPYRWIATVAGRGYRFTGAVARVAVDPDVEVGAETDIPRPGAEPRAQLHNLPAHLTELVGRDQELATLREIIKTRGLTTLTGMGGLGKTQLALHIGARLIGEFADGVWLVALERLSRPEQVAEAAAALFGLPTPANRSANEVVATYLRRKALLLILDNCEHMILPAVELVEAILSAAPDVRVLATSRESMRLAAEHVYRLSPLNIPGAAAGLSAKEASGFSAILLFSRRAEAALGAFALTDRTAPLAAEICSRLDGIALAIELAAARLKVLPLAELLERLDDRFRLLAGGVRTATPRQQTLEGAIDWSYDLLGDDERRFFRRLAVFGGGFSAAGAHRIAAGRSAENLDALDLLASLVEKSLVAPADNDAGRFRLYESTRAFCLARLEKEDAAECLSCLLDFEIATFEQAEKERPTTAAASWLRKYGPELENLRAALTWAFGSNGDARRGAQLVSCSTEIWRDFSLARERLHWLERAAEKVDGATPIEIRARLLLAPIPAIFGRREAPAKALEAIALFRQTNDKLFLAMALRIAGMAVAREGDVAASHVFLEEAETIARTMGLTRTLLLVLSTQAVLRKFAGDYAGARRYHAECLALSRSLGSPSTILLSQINLAEIDFAEGLGAEAVDRAKEACAFARQAGMPLDLADALQNLAGYLLSQGEVEGGKTAAREALELKLALNPQSWLVHCIEHLALAAAVEGDLSLAARMAGYTDHRLRAEGAARETTEQVGWSNLQRLLATGLPTEERDRLAAEGAKWPDDFAILAARGELAATC
jgi:predicted ATPase/DNA-binding winged helix-turn-helix (wHTH) protein